MVFVIPGDKRDTNYRVSQMSSDKQSKLAGSVSIPKKHTNPH